MPFIRIPTEGDNLAFYLAPPDNMSPDIAAKLCSAVIKQCTASLVDKDEWLEKIQKKLESMGFSYFDDNHVIEVDPWNASGALTDDDAIILDAHAAKTRMDNIVKTNPKRG